MVVVMLAMDVVECAPLTHCLGVVGFGWYRWGSAGEVTLVLGIRWMVCCDVTCVLNCLAVFEFDIRCDG